MSTQKTVSIEQLWLDALASYAKRTSIFLDKPSPGVSLPSTVDKLHDLITASEEKFRKFRHPSEDTKRFHDKLRLTMAYVEGVTGMISGGMNTVFPPSQIIFGAVLQLIQAAHTVSSNYDRLTSFFTKMGGFLARLSLHTDHESRTLPQALKSVLVQILATIMDLCAISTKYCGRGRTRMYFDAMTRGEDEGLIVAYETLNELVEEEMRLVQSATFQGVDKLDVSLSENTKGVERLEAKVGGIGSKLDVIDKYRSETAQGDIMKRLSKDIVNVEDDLDHLRAVRHKGTGDWILLDPEYNSWKKGAAPNNPILWISGGPGAGKSVTAARVIDDLTSYVSVSSTNNKSKSSVGYFFCRSNDDKRQYMQTIIRTVAYEVAKTDEEYRDEIKKDIAKLENPSIGLQGLWKILFEDRFGKTATRSLFLVIDGLDESDPSDRKILLGLIYNLAIRGERIKMLVVGRPEISSEFSEMRNQDDDEIAEIPRIDIAQQTKGDIKKYITSKLRKRPCWKELKNEETLDILVSKAEGMFLWAVLMVNQLVKAGSKKQVETSLAQIPKGLDELYDATIRSLSSHGDKNQLEIANEVLKWTTCAFRPLTWDELRGAVSLKLGDVYEDSLWEEVERCGSLFMMEEYADEETAEEYSDEDDGGGDGKPSGARLQIRLSHAYLRDYFHRPEIQRHTKAAAAAKHPEAIGIDLSAAQVDITLSCLDVVNGSPTSDAHMVRNYSMQKWIDHFLSVVNLDQSFCEKLVERLYKFFNDPEVTEKWVACGLLNPATRDRFEKRLLQVFGVEIKDVLPEIKAWIQSVLENPEMLFEPVGRRACELWKSSCETVIMDSGVEYDFELLSAVAARFLKLTVLDVDRVPILDVARTLIGEDDSTWSLLLYFRVVCVLWSQMRYKDACKYCRRSLELYDTKPPHETHYLIPKIHIYLADCLVKIGSCADSLVVAESALGILKASDAYDTNDMGYLLYLMGDACSRLQDKQKQASYWKLATAAAPSNAMYKSMLSDLYFELGQYDEFMQLYEGSQTATRKAIVKAIYSEVSEATGWSDRFRQAARHTGKLDFVLESYLGVMENTKRVTTIAGCQKYLGKVYWLENDDPLKAINTWNAAIQALSEVKTPNKIQLGLTNDIRHLLAKVRLLMGDVEEVEKLLPRNYLDMEHSNDTLSIVFLLGIFYRKGNMRKARECFKKCVESALVLLNDENPWNDKYGYICLKDSLIHAGNLDSGCAAAEMLIDSVPQTQKKGEAVGENEDKKVRSTEENLTGADQKSPEILASDAENNIPSESVFRHIAFCDSCGVTITGVRHTCCSCYDFDFCTKCFDTRAERQHHQQGCAPEHEFLKVPRECWKQEDKEAGFVVLNSGTEKRRILIKDWLEELRIEWDIVLKT